MEYRRLLTYAHPCCVCDMACERRWKRGYLSQPPTASPKKSPGRYHHGWPREVRLKMISRMGIGVSSRCRPFIGPRSIWGAPSQGSSDCPSCDDPRLHCLDSANRPPAGPRASLGASLWVPFGVALLSVGVCSSNFVLHAIRWALSLFRSPIQNQPVAPRRLSFPQHCSTTVTLFTCGLGPA